MTLDAEPRHYDSARKTLGLCFTENNRKKLSLLSSIIRSYKSGISDENLERHSVSFRPLYLEPPVKKKSLSNKIFSYLLIATIAIGGAFLLARHAYQSFYTIEPRFSSVKSPLTDITAPHSGIYISSLAAEQFYIRKNDLLGHLSSTPVYSPCDCYIREKFISTGQHADKDAALYSLTRLQPAPEITALLNPEDAQRLRIQSPADIRIPNSSIKGKAKIRSIAATENPQDMLVTLSPYPPIPATLHGAPVRVRFNLR